MNRLNLLVFWVVAVVVLCHSLTTLALDPLLVEEVNITCGPVALDKDTVSLYEGNYVKFIMSTASCDSIRITGDGPIVEFKLRDSDADSTIYFPTAGNYNYRVRNLAANDSLVQRQVQVISKIGTPFLGTWGIVVLLLLLIGTAWFVLSRRRVKTTGAAA